MTDQTPWHFLLNPAAGRGKALRHWRKWEPRLRAALPAMTFAQSTAEGGMAALAETAVRAGHTHLVGVGGDGTHHDILNGIIAADGLSRVTYAPLPLGTGNDWVRTLGTPRTPAAWLAMLRAGETLAHGVGRLVISSSAEAGVVALSGTSNGSVDERVLSDAPPPSFDTSEEVFPDFVREKHASEEQTKATSDATPTPPTSPLSTGDAYSGKWGSELSKERGPATPAPPPTPPTRGSQIANRESKIEIRESTAFFLNVAGLAYDATVVRRSESARFKHRFLYPFLTLFFLRDFTPPRVRIDYDGHTFEGAVHTVNFGIGRYNGGGMRLVPQADPTGGRLALTYAKALSVFAILTNSWRFYTDTIGRVPGVTITHADTVTVTPIAGRLEVEADGEWLGEGQISVGLLEERLRVVV